MLILRYCDNVEMVKNFIYDLFYFKSPRNHILVGIVVALWPEVFPRQETDIYMVSPEITHSNAVSATAQN